MKFILMLFVIPTFCLAADDPKDFGRHWATGGCTMRLCVEVSQAIDQNSPDEKLVRTINGKKVAPYGGHREDSRVRTVDYLAPMLKRSVVPATPKEWLQKFSAAVGGFKNEDQIRQAVDRLAQKNNKPNVVSFFISKSGKIFGWYVWTKGVSSFDGYEVLAE